MREAVFSALDARDAIRGARVLDLYAGSGALGLEAASRGATSVVLVESDRRAADVIAGNARDLGLAGIRVVRGTVAAHLAPDPAPGDAADLVFADPPYDVDEAALAAVLDRLRAGWLAPGGLLVVERSTRSPEPGWPDGIRAGSEAEEVRRDHGLVRDARLTSRVAESSVAGDADRGPARQGGQMTSTTTGHAKPPADVLVVFGITGDLARVMTFRSLYRLEKRGLLTCPVVGVAVDDWTLDQLVERARASIVATGEPLDEAVFGRFVERLSYVRGDFTDPATYQRVGAAIAGTQRAGVLPRDPALPVRAGRARARTRRA